MPSSQDQSATQGSQQISEQSVILQIAFAYGKVHKCPQGAQQYWYLLNRDDAAQFQLERAPSWHIENAHITKRHRRPLRSEELQHPSLDGKAFRDKLLDGTEIRLEWEAETEYWELTDDNWLQLRSTMNEYAGNKEHGGGLFIPALQSNWLGKLRRKSESIPFGKHGVKVETDWFEKKWWFGELSNQMTVEHRLMAWAYLDMNPWVTKMVPDIT